MMISLSYSAAAFSTAPSSSYNCSNSSRGRAFFPSSHISYFPHLPQSWSVIFWVLSSYLSHWLMELFLVEIGIILPFFLVCFMWVKVEKIDFVCMKSCEICVSFETLLVFLVNLVFSWSVLAFIDINSGGKNPFRKARFLFD